MLSQHYLTPGDSTTIKNSMAALYGSRLAWSDTSAMFAFMKQQLALKMFATAFADSHNVHSYGVGGSTSGGIVVSAGTDSMYISTITLASILSRLSALEGASPASISKDSLYAYYTFESNGRDTSGRGNHLTGINAPTFNTGKVGNAAYFDSTQAWYNETMVVDSATSFTVGGWVYYSPGGNYGTMFSSYNSKGWTTYNNTSAALGGPISLYSVPASGSGVVAASDSVTAARWMFVVVSYSATSDSMWLQVNNAEKVGAVATIPTAGISGVGEFTVGAHPDGTLPSIIRQMKGKVDELFVYHRVLAAAELTWYFNSGAGRTWAEAKAAMGL
jgi:hypothetical protein